MSIGHRLEAEELSDATTAELYAVLGQGDTPNLFQRGYELNVQHDVSMGGGCSLDRRTVYIDRELYQEVMDGAFSATGLMPGQIIRLWCEHEHTEKTLVDGDNPIDRYYPAHKRALRKEHMALEIILGPGKSKLYEETIWPGLLRCYKREPRKPPKDLWCGDILLDEESERDRELVRVLKKLGVVDAGKRSKPEVHYGFSQHKCIDCRMFAPKAISKETGFLTQRDGALASCSLVSGLVREDRGCDFWMAAKPNGK